MGAQTGCEAQGPPVPAVPCRGARLKDGAGVLSDVPRVLWASRRAVSAKVDRCHLSPLPPGPALGFIDENKTKSKRQRTKATSPVVEYPPYTV